MKRSRSSNEQIVENSREQETRMKPVDVCRKHGVLEATCYKHKTKFGGMEVFDNTEMFCNPRRKHLKKGSSHPWSSNDGSK